MSFFAVPLSGLNAAQAMLKTVSSNLANVDTDGYKDQNLTFNDVFSQSGIINGAGDPIQTGQGVDVASTVSDFSNGSQSATGLSSNMAIQGNGFFVVQEPTGQTAYSRAGDFTTNNAGQIVAPDGSLVLGYPATAGVVNTSAALQPLNVGSGLQAPGSATTDFSMAVNLNASAAVGSNATSSMTVYDSLGNSHQLTVSYSKTASNTWSYSVTAPDASGATENLSSGTLNFDSSGNLQSVTDSAGNTTSPTSIKLGSYNPGGGAAPVNLSWNLDDSSNNGLLTQAASANSTSNPTQNGIAAGTLNTYSIGADGTIEGKFSNGATLALGQVVLASVENTQGLQQIGNNLYQVSVGSGQASIGVPGTSGLGVITGGSVEQSNVDVASEFSKMIVAQQAYQANAKSVTTFDQVVQAALQMLSS